MAPSICATMYPGTLDAASLPLTAIATVTAGLRCAPLNGAAQNAPTKTANAQPAVMTIQPELFPLVRGSTTFATTPLPNKMSIAVPMNSATYELMRAGAGRGTGGSG